MAPEPISVDDPEDRKILTLARATRARTRAAEGASVRDRDGRTYAAATVELPTLRLSALSLAVAMAVSSGATGLEAAAVSTEADAVSEDDRQVIRDFSGAGVPVLLADTHGVAVARVEA
ncbi:cytidine deaminase [Mumia zhuanghuii]|uniref:Cytidine deaminase n=2 Tax=Mumia TaxID=1546255 RepID=A0ABW1QLJ7_9ACTN|nr:MULTISPECIES: cytidine deaminase [Mumia]KAA1423652.1 cytidine deaminase [Mumia zhuanghuii]